MRKEIVSIDKERGVYQITTTDERFYSIEAKDKVTGLPYFEYIPSVTWITGYVYKGVEFYKWLASKGWDEAEAVKAEAGDRGSKVHKAIENLVDGASVKMEDKYYNKSKETDEELTPEEYGAIVSFTRWVEEVKPKFLSSEITVISEKHNFAGTVDCVAEIDGQVWIIDWKTSANIYPSMEAQLSAYKVALKEMGKKVDNAKLAVLQVGYKRNKRGYKFTEIDDKFTSLFLPAQKFWENDNKKLSPKQIEYPLEVRLPKPEPKVKPVAKPEPKKKIIIKNKSN